MPGRRHELVEIYHHLSPVNRWLVRMYARWKMWGEQHRLAAHWIGRYPERMKITVRIWRYRFILWLSIDNVTE